MSEPGKLAKPPAGCKDMGMAMGVFIIMLLLRSPARSNREACPGNIPPFGAEITVVNPAERQVSTRLSLRVASSAALRQGVDPGRSSGPREVGGCERAPLSPPDGAGAEGMPTSVKESMKPG